MKKNLVIYSNSFLFHFSFTISALLLSLLFTCTKNKSQTSHSVLAELKDPHSLISSASCFVKVGQNPPWMKSVCWALRLYSSSWACYHMEFSGSQLAFFCHGWLAWVGGTRWLFTDTVIIMFNQQITPGRFQVITDEKKSSNSIYSYPNWTLWQS